MLMRSAATVGGFTMLSRVLGFARDILIALFLGASAAGDAFFVSFKLPNLFRRLFAEGAFNLAFVPLFTESLTAHGRVTAKAFAEDVLSVLLWVLLVVVVLAQIAMPWLMLLIAPGFSGDPVKFDLTVYLARLTFPYLLFISLVSLLSGVLNSLDRFAAAAAAPVVLNLCLIGSLLVFARVGQTPAHALAWGVAAAGVLQLLWLVWNCKRENMLPRLRLPRLTPAVKNLLVLMLPAVIGAGVVQLNLVVDMVIASLLPNGSVSHLYYADRVVQLPLGVIGVAIGTALLPSLSRQVAGRQTEDALNSQNRAIEYALLLTLPAAAALSVVSVPIVHVLFERGAFDASATATTASVLAAYSIGLPAFVLIKAFAPGYFARKDTRTPVRAAMWALIANVVLNLVFMKPFGVVGIALASVVSSWLNVVLLAKGLHGLGYFRPDRLLRRRAPRIVFASMVMMVLLFAFSKVLAPWLGGEFGLRVAALFGLVLAGVCSFMVVATVSGAMSWRELKAILTR